MCLAPGRGPCDISMISMQGLACGTNRKTSPGHVWMMRDDHLSFIILADKQSQQSSQRGLSPPCEYNLRLMRSDRWEDNK